MEECFSFRLGEMEAGDGVRRSSDRDRRRRWRKPARLGSSEPGFSFSSSGKRSNVKEMENE